MLRYIFILYLYATVNIFTGKTGIFIHLFRSVWILLKLEEEVAEKLLKDLATVIPYHEGVVSLVCENHEFVLSACRWDIGDCVLRNVGKIFSWQWLFSTFHTQSVPHFSSASLQGKMMFYKILRFRLWGWTQRVEFFIDEYLQHAVVTMQQQYKSFTTQVGFSLDFPSVTLKIKGIVSRKFAMLLLVPLES
jgi:hypothetical protein